MFGGMFRALFRGSQGYLLVQGVFKGCFLALHLIMSSPAAPASIVSEVVEVLRVLSSDSSSPVGH